MGEHVAVPFWLAALVAAFAVWALYEHVVMPALRWMVTQPANQVIDKLSDRLRIGIRPFQRTRRQALVHRLLTDPKVQQAAELYAQHNRVPLPAVHELAVPRVAFFLEGGHLVAPLLGGQRHCNASAMGAEELQKFLAVVKNLLADSLGARSKAAA